MQAKTIKRLAISITVLSMVTGMSFFIQRYRVTSLAHSVSEQAERAHENSDFETAETLFRQYLVMFSNEVDVQLKYAATLLEQANLPRRPAEALQVYSDILRRNPGRADVRQWRLDLEMEMGQFLGNYGAESDLSILLALWETLPAVEREKPSPDHGNLFFLIAQCREAADNATDAHIWYQKAIKFNAPQKLEAYRRLSWLHRPPSERHAFADPAAGHPRRQLAELP